MTIAVGDVEVVESSVSKTVLLGQFRDAVATLTHMESCTGVKHPWARGHIERLVTDQQVLVDRLFKEVSDRMF